MYIHINIQQSPLNYQLSIIPKIYDACSNTQKLKQIKNDEFNRLTVILTCYELLSLVFYLDFDGGFEVLSQL